MWEEVTRYKKRELDLLRGLKVVLGRTGNHTAKQAGRVREPLETKASLLIKGSHPPPPC